MQQRSRGVFHRLGDSLRATGPATQYTCGAIHLIEMNPRCSPLCHLQLGKGRDMIRALWAQLSGQPLRETPRVTQMDMIAYFPQAWNCRSEVLKSSFHDLPLGEPELVQDLLRPWPDRSLVLRIGHVLTTVATTQKC